MSQSGVRPIRSPRSSSGSASPSAAATCTLDRWRASGTDNNNRLCLVLHVQRRHPYKTLELPSVPSRDSCKETSSCTGSYGRRQIDVNGNLGHLVADHAAISICILSNIQASLCVSLQHSTDWTADMPLTLVQVPVLFM